LAGVLLACLVISLGRGLTHLSDGGAELAVVRPPSYGVDELHTEMHPFVFLLGLNDGEQH
jgi:hypothetical protein